MVEEVFKKEKMINKSKLKNLPKQSGIYIFKKGKKELYIGKATNLKQRVLSYFAKELNRSPLIKEMVETATSVDTLLTDNVLDALILESFLIKKNRPFYNTKEKDNSTFNFVVITKEDFPKILVKRGRLVAIEKLEKENLGVYGPFTSGVQLKEALRIIRKAIPFRDKCKLESKRGCFNAQLGLCPGVCVGELNKREYGKIIKRLKMFFEGKKLKIISDLEKEMNKYASSKEYELAGGVKTQIMKIKHLQDISLIKQDHAEGSNSEFRIEGYDVSHISGTDAVGVMVVSIDGVLESSEYRVFKIRQDNKRSDIDSLKEILVRRSRNDWTEPNLVVVDGGKAHLNVANKFFADIPKVSVVKDEKHKPKGILGDKVYARSRESEILEINNEAHRFAIYQHRKRRNSAF